MTDQFVRHCGDNPRCEACPIERLPDSEDRVMAGEAVRLVVKDLWEITDDQNKLAEIQELASDTTGLLTIPHLAPYVVGAAAIVATGNCKQH